MDCVRQTETPTVLWIMSAARQSKEGLSVPLMAVWFSAQTIIAAVPLFTYGQYWPKQWQERVPWTNMEDVQRAVGKPGKASPYTEGIVQWDYARWWSGTAKVYFETNGKFNRIFTEW